MASFIIPANLLKAIVAAAVAHAGIRDDKSVISGILIETDETAGSISFVSTDGYRLYHRTVARQEQIAGAYPNYRQICPESFSHAVTVDRKALLAATKAMPGQDRDGNVMTLHCNGRVDIAGTDKSGNALSQSLPLASEARHDGAIPEVSLRFNSRHLADVLKALEASGNASARQRKVNPMPDIVTLRLNGPVQAAIMTAGTESEASDEGAYSLLMPIRA